MNRLWLFAAALTMAVLGGPGIIADTPLPERLFYPAAAVVLALVNLAFCAEYLQSHRAHAIFIAKLSRDAANEIEFAPGYNLADAAHALYTSSLVRLGPLAHFLPERSRASVKHVKLFVDLVFYAVPVGGCFLAAWHGGLLSYIGLSGVVVLPWWWVKLPFALLFLATLAASAVLVRVGVKYWRDGYGAE
jgi:hypothetical protein